MFLALFRLLHRLPSWLRPAVVGALAVSALTAGRLLLALPGLLRQTNAVRGELWLVAAAPALGAVAGLAYALADRTVARVPGAGPYLTGVVTVGAYLGAMAALMIGSGQEADTPFWLALGVCTVFFGLIVGHWLFRAEPAPPAP